MIRLETKLEAYKEIVKDTAKNLGIFDEDPEINKEVVSYKLDNLNTGCTIVNLKIERSNK